MASESVHSTSASSQLRTIGVLLRARGLDPDAKDCTGQSALHCVLRRMEGADSHSERQRYLDVCKLLCTKSDLLTVDRCGRSCFDIGAASDFPEVSTQDAIRDASRVLRHVIHDGCHLSLCGRDVIAGAIVLPGPAVPLGGRVAGGAAAHQGGRLLAGLGLCPCETSGSTRVE